MKKCWAFFGVFLLSQSLSAQDVELLSFKQLQKKIQSVDEGVLVVNFWATWCRPCIEEIPDFEKVRQQFKDKPVSFLYVSLDFSNVVEKKVTPFAKKKMPGADVVVLDQPKGDAWISALDKTWDGAIPMTLILNKSSNYRAFFNKPLSYEALNDALLQAFK